MPSSQIAPPSVVIGKQAFFSLTLLYAGTYGLFALLGELWVTGLLPIEFVRICHNPMPHAKWLYQAILWTIGILVLYSARSFHVFFASRHFGIHAGRIRPYWLLMLLPITWLSWTTWHFFLVVLLGTAIFHGLVYAESHRCDTRAAPRMALAMAGCCGITGTLLILLVLQALYGCLLLPFACCCLPPLLPDSWLLPLTGCWPQGGAVWPWMLAAGVLLLLGSAGFYARTLALQSHCSPARIIAGPARWLWGLIPLFYLVSWGLLLLAESPLLHLRQKLADETMDVAWFGPTPDFQETVISHCKRLNDCQAPHSPHLERQCAELLAALQRTPSLSAHQNRAKLQTALWKRWRHEFDVQGEPPPWLAATMPPWQYPRTLFDAPDILIHSAPDWRQQLPMPEALRRLRTPAATPSTWHWRSRQLAIWLQNAPKNAHRQQQFERLGFWQLWTQWRDAGLSTGADFSTPAPDQFKILLPQLQRWLVCGERAALEPDETAYQTNPALRIFTQAGKRNRYEGLQEPADYRKLIEDIKRRYPDEPQL